MFFNPQKFCFFFCFELIEFYFFILFFDSYVGRGVSASPATGSKRQHLKEAAQLLEDAFAGL
jgi:hypothetical protein